MIKKNISPIVFFCYQREAILKSQHDPFLSGNIAPRDVIKIISRKAISSLVNYRTSTGRKSLSVFVRNTTCNFRETDRTYRLNPSVQAIYTGNPVAEPICRQR